MASAKEIIAHRIAQELRDGNVVNLGIGLPTLVANYVPEGVSMSLQSENGIIGMGPLSKKGKEDKDLINAGNQHVTVLPGAAFLDSATSFGVVRGGHVDLTVLGALQVDETGTLASHIVPGKMVSGMGGAMDLVVGAKKVIIATLHMAKGEPKLLKKITLPATAFNKVDLIVTEYAVIKITEKGFLLKEIAPGITVEELQGMTGANLMIADDLIEMDVLD